MADTYPICLCYVELLYSSTLNSLKISLQLTIWINVKIPLCIFFSRYSSVVLKEYICAFVGHYQSRILEVSFPSNVVACKTVPESIVGRYPLLWEFAILV